MYKFSWIFLSLLVFTNCSSVQVKNRVTFDKMLTTYKYPFAVKFFKFKSQKKKLRMAYMDLNQESKKVIVLLHGKNFSGFYWEKIAKDLVSNGYRVIIPDQIGFGKSSKPDYYQYSFYNLSYNTKLLLNELNVDKYILVGHSMGGMLASHFTYLYPQSVKQLVLINPIGLEPYLKYVEFKDPNFFYQLELKKTPKAFKNYQKKNYYDGQWRADYDSLLVPISGQMRGDEWKEVAWNNALTYGPIFNEDITSKLSDIKNEVLLIIGTRDKTGPGRFWKKDGVKRKLGNYQVLGKETNRKLQNSKLIELEGLGHMPQFEDYERFKQVFYKNLIN